MDNAPTPGLIHIDGREVSFHEGQTVLQAALAAGVKISHLCYRPELAPIGSCRLCLVEVAGRMHSACTLPATAGQNITSVNEALLKIRQALVIMLLEQGRHVCTNCERTGDCRLQETAADLDTPAIALFPPQDFPPLDNSHPDVTLDRGRCILCGICIQASRELDGKNLFAFGGSGSSVSVIVESASGLLKDSAIAAEDHAVRLCPVGALILNRERTQTLGFSSFDFFDTTDWSG